MTVRKVANNQAELYRLLRLDGMPVAQAESEVARSYGHNPHNASTASWAGRLREVEAELAAEQQ